MVVRLGLMMSAVLLLLHLSTCANANVLINGDFENQPNYVSGAGFTLLTGSQMPGWTIETGYGVTVHGENVYPQISGNYSVNLDAEGLNGRNANFYQDFASISGAIYNIDFDHLGWMENGGIFSVTIVDTITAFGLYNSGDLGHTDNIVHESDSFLGTGNPLRLRVFQTTTPGTNDNTNNVDNFSVTTSAVPEPATWMVWGGLCAVGAVIAYYRRSTAKYC